MDKIIIEEFLKESNAIEGVYDEDSLKQAKKAWEFLINEDVLTVNVILKTHKQLMKNQPITERDKGAFRKCRVWVGGCEGADWTFVPVFTQNWCFETMRKSPKVDAKKLHIEFEKLHPFIDGNGRIGRMLMNWTRVKRNNQKLLVIKESERQKYYEWFK